MNDFHSRLLLPKEPGHVTHVPRLNCYLSTRLSLDH
jgi:hypothetical protein